MHLILQDRFWVVHIPFVRIVKFEFLAHLPVDYLAHPVVSSLIHFCADMLHLLIMWLIVSSLLPHNLHLLFCCVLSILALIWLVLMALFCATIRKAYQNQLIVFHWSLSDSKSLQVFGTLFSILADFSAVVWMVSTRIFIYNSFSLFTNLLVTVPSTLITVGITATFMFHSFFFCSLYKILFLSLFKFLFYFQFLIIFHWVFTQDIERGKLCIYAFCCVF